MSEVLSAGTMHRRNVVPRSTIRNTVPTDNGERGEVARTDEVPRRRADARRNEDALLDAAAAAFVATGVEAPGPHIRPGAGLGPVHRHFPTRADLVVAVYRHQVEACADAGPTYLAE